MAEKTYNVGIYCRLSNDDERAGESVSIENQNFCFNGTSGSEDGMRSTSTSTTGILERTSSALVFSV